MEGILHECVLYLAWKPRVLAADLNVSATRLKRVTVKRALSLSSATTLEDLGTCARLQLMYTGSTHVAT